MNIIPCPCCKGSGKRYDTDTAEWTDEVCTACKGSKVLETSARAWQAYRNNYRSNGWSIFEKQYLWELRRQGVTYKQIAILLDRTPGSVSTRIHKMKRAGEWELV